MSFVLRTAAVAASLACTVVASMQTFPNITHIPHAADIVGWKYEKCGGFGVPSDWIGVEINEVMTDERCTLECSAYDFAAVHMNDCACSNSDKSIVKVGDGECVAPCPGDPSEACGGQVGAISRRSHHHQHLAARTHDEHYYPDKTSDDYSPAYTLSPGAPLWTIYKKAQVPSGVLYLNLITSVYIDFCPTCPGGTSTCTARSTATLTGCGCATPTYPSIPMYTKTAACDSEYCEQPYVTYAAPCTTATAAAAPAPYYPPAKPYYPENPASSTGSSPYPSSYVAPPAHFTGGAVGSFAGAGVGVGGVAGVVLALLAML